MGYLMENWPESNSKESVFYALTIRRGGKLETRHYYTVDEVHTAVSQIRYNKWEIVRARRFCKGSWKDFTPETAAEKNQRENENHCECIALEMELYAAGEIHRCPDCGETISLIDAGEKYKCPHCGAVNDTDDFEQCSLWDYFDNDILDFEYRIGGNRDYRSVRIMVACGGPNIYIDTATRKVQLYWWTDYAEYSILSDVCDEIDAVFEEMYICS